MWVERQICLPDVGQVVSRVLTIEEISPTSIAIEQIFP